MTTKRKTTLTVKQSIDFNMLLYTQEKCIIEVMKLLKELKSISILNVSPYYDEDLHGKARNNEYQKVLEIYNVLLSFPLKHCKMMIQHQAKYYNIQAIVCCTMGIIIKALRCEYIANDNVLFKTLFEGSESKFSILEALEYCLERIEELKQDIA